MRVVLSILRRQGAQMARELAHVELDTKAHCPATAALPRLPFPSDHL